MKKNIKKLAEYIASIEPREIVISVAIFFLCVLIYLYAIASNTMVVKASSNNSNSLPYNIANHPSLNTMLTDDLINAMMTFANSNNVLPATFNQDNMLIWLSDYNTTQGWYYVNVACDLYCETSVSESTDITNSPIRFRTTYIYNNKNTVYRFQFKYNNGNILGWGTNQYYNAYYDLFGTPQTITTDLGTYTTNYPAYYTGDAILYNNDFEVIVMRTTPVINYGQATQPEPFANPYFNPNSHAQPPEEVPSQVTINNYTWNTYNPPTIDDTDIISTLKSLINVVNYLMGWLKDNISGEFQNLLSNLSAFFDYIGQTIQYYGGLIISNIQNLITTFYNNMVSLVEDIAEKIAYISEPFDSSALTVAFEDMQIYEDYERCGQLIDDAFGFFDDITEPNSFTIPIDLRNITILHQTQIFYLDLGWINSSKNLIRAFMWMVTTFGLLYTVIDSIPDYIQGQDE